MYIGQLAQLTGCTPKAIRLYESLGLLPAPTRQGSYRVYTSHHIDVVRIIRIAQSMGFKLAELGALSPDKQARGAFPLAVAVAGIEARRQQVKAQQEALVRMDQQLAELQQSFTRLFGPASSVCAVDQRCSTTSTPGPPGAGLLSPCPQMAKRGF